MVRQTDREPLINVGASVTILPLNYPSNSKNVAHFVVLYPSVLSLYHIINHKYNICRKKSRIMPIIAYIYIM